MIVINESIAKASPINTIATVLMLERLDSFLFKVILLCDFCDFSLLRRRGENLLDKFLFIVMFYRKFCLCITKTLGKSHTHMVAHIQRLPLGGRFSVSPIITKIGRENNISAKICKLLYKNELKIVFLFIIRLCCRTLKFQGLDL